jgi:threonyl-tRNA synthetase
METKYIALATRPENRAGSDEFWDRAEGMLAEAARKAGVEPVIAEGDGAFYAPKLDFIVQDAIGRSGRAARSSSTTCCPNGSAPSTSPRTAPSSGR